MIGFSKFIEKIVFIGDDGDGPTPTPMTFVFSQPGNVLLFSNISNLNPSFQLETSFTFQGVLMQWDGVEEEWYPVDDTFSSESGTGEISQLGNIFPVIYSGIVVETIPAWEQINNLAIADGWTANYISSFMNPAFHTVVEIEGTDRFETISDSLGNFPILDNAGGALGSPIVVQNAFGELTALQGSSVSGLANFVIESTYPMSYIILVNPFDGGSANQPFTILDSSLSLNAGGLQINGGEIGEAISLGANFGPHIFSVIIDVDRVILRIDGIEFFNFLTDSVATGLFALGLFDGVISGPVVRNDVNLSAVEAMESLLMDLSGIATGPIVYNAEKSGIPVIGQTFTGSYSYSGPLPESIQTYQWLIADDNQGAGATPIPGANSIAYLIPAEDLGRWIAFSVISGDGFAVSNTAIGGWGLEIFPE